MTPLDQPSRAEDPEAESYSVWMREEKSLQYDAYEKPMMSRRAIRNGLVFCAVFYGGLASIVGVGAWIVMRFL